ncbi:unnamed protein product [Meganyctiphanes norvegica]|uniref:Uncharacterized protein n=1 Tax=Meganyctiphanes norvegica TaxID=48144 RepID=A0AAV2Q421_MEGNR
MLYFLQVMQDPRLLKILNEKKSSVREHSPNSDIKQNGCEENGYNMDKENRNFKGKSDSSNKNKESKLNDEQISEKGCGILKNNKNSPDFLKNNEQIPPNSTNDNLNFDTENVVRDIENPSITSEIKNQTNSSEKEISVMDNSHSDVKDVKSSRLHPNIQKRHGVSQEPTTLHVSASSIYENPDDELEDIIPLDQLDSYMKDLQIQRKQQPVKIKQVETSTSPTNLPIIEQEKIDITSDKKDTQVEGLPPLNGSQMILEEIKNCESNYSSNSSSPTHVEHPTNNTSINFSPVRNLSRLSNNSENESNNKGNLPTSELKQDSSGSESDGDDSSFDLDLSDYDSDNDVLDMTLQSWQDDCGQDSKKNKKKCVSLIPVKLS